LINGLAYNWRVSQNSKCYICGLSLASTKNTWRKNFVSKCGVAGG